MLELHGPLETRTQPPGQQFGLGGRARHADLLHVGDAGPEGCELAAPPAGARPGDVGHRDALEHAHKLGIRGTEIGPLGAVDDEPVDDAEHAFERSPAEVGNAAPA